MSSPNAPGEFPLNGSADEKLRFLLNYAVMAPSSHNTQPWRFELEEGGVALFADPTRAFRSLDPGCREVFIACGAALFNLRMALAHYGFSDRVSLFPDESEPCLVSRVALSQRSGQHREDDSLFAAIPARQTNREAYAKEPIPESILDELVEAARVEGARLVFVVSEQSRKQLASLVGDADRLLWADPSYCEELASWVRTGSESDHDGLPWPSHVLGRIPIAFAQQLILNYDMSAEVSGQDHQAIMRAPAVAVLETKGDDRQAWVAAGQALERVLLLAQTKGLCASYFISPVEVPELREKLQATFLPRGHAQMVFRLGSAQPIRRTPRRPVDDIVD